MKRLTRSSAYAFLASALLIFLAYSCDQNEVIQSEDDSGQVLRLTAHDLIEAGPDGTVLVYKDLPNSGGLSLVFSYPDMQTYKVIVEKSGVTYDMADFRFFADMSQKIDVLDQQMQEIAFADLIPAYVNGELFKPMGTDGLFAKAIPATDDAQLPYLEVKSAAYAELQNSVIIPDSIIHIPSNCPPSAGASDCSGPCAFTFIYDDQTVVHTGECVHTTHCYCKSKKRTVIPHNAVVVPGDG